MARDVHNASPLGRPGSRAHRSIAQNFEWRGGRDVHIVVGMNMALASTLTIEIHSAASEFQRRISTSARMYCVGRQLASAFECSGARVGLSAGRAHRDPHAANRGLPLTMKMQWVGSGLIGRTGAPEPTCCAIAGLPSPLKHAGTRAGLSARHVRRNAHAAQSRARTHH